MTTLAGEVLARAEEDPGAVAVVDLAGDRAHTRGQLVTDALALAARWEEAGLGAGDVASVQLPNRYEAVVVALAALRLGMVLNPLLPNYRAKELDYIFRKASPRLVAIPDVYRGFDHDAMVDSLGDALPAGVVRCVVPCGEAGGAAAADLLGAVRAWAGAEPRAPLPAAARTSELIFSSGTEAAPKGILHTEQTTNAGVRAMREFLGLGAGDVVWMPSPVGHSTGFNFGLRLALVLGLPLVLQDRWDAATAVDLVRRHGCTYTLAATTFLQDVVDELGRRGERIESLRRFCCGGAPVPPELVVAAEERGIGVLRLYGSTEALVVTCNRPDAPLRVRSVTDGVPLPGVELRLAPDGEIEVRSPQAATGYFEDPERTAATFTEDGWVRSGDLGAIDAGGALSIVGRKKEIVIRGGINIAPREIEELLLTYDEVERCAVVGFPDDRLGEIVGACVVLRPGTSLTLDVAVERLRAAGLATYKLPQRWHVLDALPVTASGKIQKHVLRAELS